MNNTHLPNQQKIWSSPGWSEYALLDFGNGRRLERFGELILVRPDVRATAKPTLPELTWRQASAQFIAQSDKTGAWKFRAKLPEKWQMQWRDVSFWAKITPTKHTGVFPEQAVEWQLLHECIVAAKARQRAVKVLNLFAYTGIASLVAAHAGAEVVTVDASRPAMNWFRENQELAGLLDRPVRMILEDVIKFLQREQKRGHTYDIILLDPPAFGNGPHGEKWRFEQQFPELLRQVLQVLSSEPLLLLINAYSEKATPEYLEQQFLPAVKQLRAGNTWVGRLALQSASGNLLSTGTVAYWKANQAE